MKPEIKKLIKTFESDLVGQERFNAFLLHCFYGIRNPKKKSHSKKIINKFPDKKFYINTYGNYNPNADNVEVNKL